MELRTPAETETVGSALAGLLQIGDVVALSGDLGTGKTTLARGLLRGLGFDGEVSSPTFPIVQIYDGPEMLLPLWHVDLYRIEHGSELPELALDEAREDAAIVIEWPERMGRELWPESLRLTLAFEGSSGRALTALVPPAWEARWPPR